MKLNIVFFGTPSFVIPILDALTKTFDVVGVVTTPDTLQGRKKILTSSPIKQFITNNSPSVHVLTPEDLATTKKQLVEMKPDLFVVAAYGKIIPQSILDIPQHGSLNVHPSLLPKYRGPSPIQTAIVNGDHETGVSVIKMDSEMDHGAIVSQWITPIQKTDTFVSLHQTLFTETAEKLPEIIEKYVRGTLQPKQQDASKVSFCQKITKERGYFDIGNPPSLDDLDRMIRGYYPWPTAWTRIKIKNDTKIMKLFPKERIQLEGGKEMSMKEFLNGYPELTPQLQQLFLRS